MYFVYHVVINLRCPLKNWFANRVTKMFVLFHIKTFFLNLIVFRSYLYTILWFWDFWTTDDVVNGLSCIRRKHSSLFFWFPKRKHALTLVWRSCIVRLRTSSIKKKSVVIERIRYNEWILWLYVFLMLCWVHQVLLEVSLLSASFSIFFAWFFAAFRLAILMSHGTDFWDLFFLLWSSLCFEVSKVFEIRFKRDSSVFI